MAVAAAPFFLAGYSGTEQVVGDGSNSSCYHVCEEQQGKTETSIGKRFRQTKLWYQTNQVITGVCILHWIAGGFLLLDLIHLNYFLRVITSGDQSGCHGT